jgi:hypothetical protein
MGDVSSIHPDRIGRAELKERFKLVSCLLAIYSIPVIGILFFA